MKFTAADEETRRFSKSVMRQPDKHCVYCGDWYQCRDHYIPMDWTGGKRTFYAGDVVPCCNECNQLLGNTPIFSLSDRAAFLIPRVKERSKKWFKTPEWHPKELREIGYNIRKQIERAILIKRVYSARISNLELMSNGFPVIPIE